jgi:hypothetical protein
MAKQLAIWLWKAWPIWLMFPLLGVHFLVLSRLPELEDLVLANKIAATATQIIGGGFVLYSVDSNLGLFRSESLVKTVGSWFKSCPLFRRTVSAKIECANASSAHFGSAAAISQPSTTIVERLAEVERQIVCLRTEIAANDQAIRRRVDKVNESLSISIASNQDALHRLAEKVVEATVGGFKQQAFGVMLVIYGAVTSVFT